MTQSNPHTQIHSYVDTRKITREDTDTRRVHVDTINSTYSHVDYVDTREITREDTETRRIYVGIIKFARRHTEITQEDTDTRRVHADSIKFTYNYVDTHKITRTHTNESDKCERNLDTWNRPTLTHAK